MDNKFVCQNSVTQQTLVSFKVTLGNERASDNTMLVSTGIIDHVKNSLHQIEKLYLNLFHFPYKIRCYKDQGGESESPAENELKPPLFRFEDNPKYTQGGWILHLAFLISAVISTLYQSTFEDQHVLGFSIHLYEASCLAVSASLAYFHRRKRGKITAFYNQVLHFESRITSLTPKRQDWRQFKYTKMILFGIKSVRTTFPILSFGLACSVAVYPSAPWKLIPVSISEKFSNSDFCQFGSNILGQLIMRAITFWHTYIVISVNLNHYFVLATLAFFSAQGSLYYMILAFRGILETGAHSYKYQNRLDSIVRIYREIQLLCWDYNSIHKLAVIPPLLILGVMGISVSLFVIAYLSKSGDIMGILIFCNVLANSIWVILLWFHLALSLHNESRRLLKSGVHTQVNQDNLILQSKREEERLLLRYWKSFPVLKIYFFESNFFESSTPLVILNFSMGCAINLILLEH